MFIGNGFGRNCMLITRIKIFLIFGEGPTQGLDGTTLTAEKLYSINFTRNNK